MRKKALSPSIILRSIGEGLITADSQGQVIFINPVAEALTRWKQEEARGMPLQDIFNIINEKTGRQIEDLVAKVMQQGGIVGLEDSTLLIARDGTRRPVDDSIAPIKDGQGNFIGLVLIFSDVTERRNQERKLKESLQAKSAFTSMVSHELRTPLATLKESISLISEGIVGAINQELKRFLEIARRNTDRLARLINQVLDFQVLETGKMIFKMQDHDLNTCVKEVRETMLSMAQKKNLDFILRLDTNLPKIRFDRDKIIQVLENLVNNSLKVTPEGSIIITTSQPGHNFIQVSVQDTGPGIREKDIPRLFRHYEQLERKAGGTGLGLAISSEIIKAHGGKIWAESKFGQGTIFHFVLPVKSA